MTEIYCDFVRGTSDSSPGPLKYRVSALIDAVEEVRRTIGNALQRTVDVGIARTLPPRFNPIAVYVEFFFDESSVRNELSRRIEAEAEVHEMIAHIEHNTLVRQTRLDMVEFAANPRAVTEALRSEIPNVPLSFRYAGSEDAVMRRYEVIAHNVRHIENFNGRETMDSVDRILGNRLFAMGGYHRCTRS